MSPQEARQQRFWQCALSSSHFDFEAYGGTAEEARAALARTLARHADQYDLEPDWWEDYEITSRMLAIGTGYRDRSPCQ